MTIKTETMYRMEAMRAAGLQPDMTITNDTLVLGFNGSRLIPSQKWLDLYNSNISVRLAYDQAKYGPQGKAATITPPEPDFSNMTSEQIYEHIKKPKQSDMKREPFIDVTPIPETPKQPMDRATLIAAARGEAKTLDVKDSHIAWLLDELARQLEAAVDPDDATNLED